MNKLLRHNSTWVATLSLLFILLNGFFLFKGAYYAVLLPFALIIAYMSFYYQKQLLFFVIFCTPFSLNLESLDLGTDFGFYLPTEPILFGFTMILLLSGLLAKSYNKELFKHPITQVILLYLAWLFITSITSERPMVSIKFLVSKLWFIVPCYFFGVSILNKLKNIYLVQWFYLISLTIVVSITIVRHYGYGFDQEIAHWIMSPFFKDHTSYGAIVAFFVPIAFVMLLRKGNTPAIQFTLLSIFAILFFGLLYSYTRAAWLSLLASVGVYLMFRFKIKFKYALGTALLAGIIGFGYMNEINMSLSKNKTDSSENLSKHIESISNISTDASNLERINRWNCAIEMFKERPFFGWGGGTYSFEYASFQHSSDLTIISTNFGDAGNAHSEYLGALAETGMVGLLLLLFLLGFVFYRASILYLTLKDYNTKLMIMGIILALTSYFAHGFLNNYLDTDKASVPIWICIATIVAIDLKQKASSKS